MKAERMSVKEFLNGKEPETFQAKLKRHLDKYGIVYKIVGSTILIFVAGGGFDYAFAADSSIDLDKEAKKLYKELLNVGKWIIIFKGGIDTLKAMGNGDMDGAKKSFFSYLLVFLLLKALPYGMDKIDGLF